MCGVGVLLAKGIAGCLCQNIALSFNPMVSNVSTLRLAQKKVHYENNMELPKTHNVHKRLNLVTPTLVQIMTR